MNSAGLVPLQQSNNKVGASHSSRVIAWNNREILGEDDEYPALGQ
jgi:hypothetical protein